MPIAHTYFHWNGGSKRRLRRVLQGALAVVSGIVLFLGVAHGAETRYHQYCKKAKGSGGAVTAVAATYFGGSDAEEFITAGFAPDGGILAIGNAWGPKFPEAANLLVIGEEHHAGGSPYSDPAKKQLNRQSPNMAAFIVCFKPDMSAVSGVARFGWGVANATHGLIGADGAVYLSGRCGPGFAGIAASGKIPVQTIPPPDPSKAKGADLYLARVAPDLKKAEWALVFEKAEAASDAWERRVGAQPGVRASFRDAGELVFVAHDRLYAISVKGGQPRDLGATKGGVLLGADPREGACYLGGDENTKTGREPWRRPFFCKFDREGKMQWEIWRWNSKTVGEDKYRLVSDSGTRALAFGSEGRLIVAGWSDGGNSVFLRQPKDLDAKTDFRQGFIDSLWGSGVGKFSWLMVVDGKTQTFVNGTVWCAFLTDKNKPNSALIENLATLDDGRIAFVGSASSALVETPDAWARAYPQGTGGANFSLLSADLKDLLFSTALPTAQGPLTLAAKGTRIVIAGGAAAPAEKEKEGLAPILPRALQSKIAGEKDGYILLVECPEAK